MSDLDDSAMSMLELDLDVRLAELWGEATQMVGWDLDAVAAFMRAAYGRGYTDALSEDDRGKLMREHGYSVPLPRPLS